ncbi:MAG TPA: glycosyl hydrolase family 65 protein [Polyangiaceae bacterium]|nr:glycosyl hydrolase family 65 protein [Polyangiaceae bacterium]
MPDYLDQGTRYLLESPTLAPQASAYLWNRRMMLQITCRGYAVAQFMQPEPAKYAHVPTLAQTSFMQPEQPFFAHHPGRFFYVRDDETMDLFSAPYEPARVPLDVFEFEPGLSDIRFRARKAGLELRLTLSLTKDDVVELWTAELTNCGHETRRVSLIPYFPVGYASWMNFGGRFEPALGAVVASAVAPYQKLQDYFKRKDWKDLTYLVCDHDPIAYEANQAAFEGEGGLREPDALKRPMLQGGEAHYELPACALQFSFELPPGQTRTLKFLFGPAKDHQEIRQLKQKYLTDGAFERAHEAYSEYVSAGAGCLRVQTPDPTFNSFVNHWLPRQVFYHGDTNRLTTDPQTRNFMQDAMGMAFIDPRVTRRALLLALSQQKAKGEMPDGVLLYPGAELKYINQIPHTDHAVWLVICLEAYLAETADWTLLDESLAFADDPAPASVYEHLCRAMEWLISARDARGLSYIAQGDWCDPMNMVGYKGRGVSGWLTQALSFALQRFIPYCRARGDETRVRRYELTIQELNAAIQRELWDGSWYARGITDDGVSFGTRKDREGRIFLNTQSWALLCRAPTPDQIETLLQAVHDQLDTPYGVELCGPPFTHMREDIGRVTQKFPGSAENGAVYNHAAAFYAAALYSIGKGDLGYSVLRRMLPGPELSDIQQRNQLPIFVPNYYRGAFRQLPRTAGRSSQLFNTGTAAWFYRIVVERLIGLRGEGDGLHIEPLLPEAWPELRATRLFRGAVLELRVTRGELSAQLIVVDGKVLTQPFLTPIRAGKKYTIEVQLPARS